MKQINAVKQIFIVALLCAANVVSGQIHPLAFSNANNANWYADYVGLRFEVTSPAIISGEKQYQAAWSGATPWGAPVNTPIVNDTIVMGTAGAGMPNDSFGGGTFTPGSMNRKIAVIWRGPEGSGAFNFSDKAIHAQNAGAVACVIINEYAGQGPVGMSAFTTGATIPTFMIGNLDGIAISALYRAGTTITMTITPWGLGLRNDIGFVPDGAAAWHAYAVPHDQILPGVAMQAPYKGLDGAFIANYGSSNAINVKVAATLYYTANIGGGKVMLHTDTSSGESTFWGLAHAPIDPTADSIMAMFTTPEYDFAPSSAGDGRYDLTYTLKSDTANQNPLDTSLTVSFYTTDSIYSKGRYDFVNNAPISTLFEGATGGTDFVWGPMYYVAHGHDAVSSLQFSLYNPNGTLGPITAGPMNLFVFKWVDGSGGQPMDSIVENGELSIVTQGVYTFNGTTDTSGVVFKLTNLLDPVTGRPEDHAAWLDSNSWYYVAAEVPGTFFLGCDGGPVDAYPRIYGRANATGYLEYSNFNWNGDYSVGTNTMTSLPASPNTLVSFPGTAYIQAIDSFNYAGQKGLIPSIAMIVTGTPDTSHLHDGVAGLAKPFADVNLYPIPADDYVNVSVGLDHIASTVTYTIIDGLGRFVSKVSHYNVQNETYKMSTSNLAPGVYYLVFNANGKALSRKFTIVR